MTMKTFFSIVAVIFTAVVVSIFVAGYISKNNQAARTSYESTLQVEVEKMTTTMNAAASEIEQLKQQNEALTEQIATQENTTKKGAPTKNVVVTKTVNTKTTPVSTRISRESDDDGDDGGSVSIPTNTVIPVKTPPVVTTPTTTSAPTTTGAVVLTMSLVGKHASASDCWIVVSGKVYSVASYISMHPGGRSAILNQCGGDATTAFTTQGGGGRHSSTAYSLLNTFLVGSVGASVTL